MSPEACAPLGARRRGARARACRGAPRSCQKAAAAARGPECDAGGPNNKVQPEQRASRTRSTAWAPARLGTRLGRSTSSDAGKASRPGRAQERP